jgi:glycosyltransferase involved in cell wall biosynthesis
MAQRETLLSISYVVPTLNRASTLDMTLYSIRSQKNVDANIIVVDSGSTDGTLEICKRWNVDVLYAEPGNIYRAINTGLRQCNTDWLAYINSDDWLYPDSLTRLIEYGNTLNADVVYGNCDYIDEFCRFIYSFNAIKPEQLLSLFKMGVFGFAQPAAIFRSQVYKQLDGFNENYCFSADADFYIRALQSNFRFLRLPGSSVACFRIHKNQLSNRYAQQMHFESQKITTLGITNLIDFITFLQWRISNVPHYLLRLLRQSLLSEKITITKSMKI